MCGILYVQRKDGKPAARAIIKRYHKQKTRGQQGFGYVAVQDNKVVSYRREGTADEILKALEKETASEILFHHRLPTSTPNVPEAAHPLFVSDEKLEFSYFIAHNGVIRNTYALHNKHTKDGYAYRTLLTKSLRTHDDKSYDVGEIFNDSECLAIETALALEGKQRYIGTEGPAAVIGFKCKGTEVVERFFYRNSSNPLKHFEDKTMIAITSEGDGDFVLPFNVMHLTPNGSEKVEPIIESPSAYTAVVGHHTPYPYSHAADTDWDDMIRGYLPKPRTTPENLPVLEFDADDLTTWEPAELWAEYLRVLSVGKELMDEIGSMDAKVKGQGASSTADLLRSAELLKKLENHMAYQKELEEEIAFKAPQSLPLV